MNTPLWIFCIPQIQFRLLPWLHVPSCQSLAQFASDQSRWKLVPLRWWERMKNISTCNSVFMQCTPHKPAICFQTSVPQPCLYNIHFRDTIIHCIPCYRKGKGFCLLDQINVKLTAQLRDETRTNTATGWSSYHGAECLPVNSVFDSARTTGVLCAISVVDLSAIHHLTLFLAFCV